MNKEIYVTGIVSQQKNFQKINKPYNIEGIQEAIETFEHDYGDDAYLVFDKKIDFLKKNCYSNIIQGKGDSLLQAKDSWNQLYFIDCDFKKWTAGEDGMRKCIADIQAAFPNYLMIKPSNRFGLHTVLSSDSQCYTPEEHVYYAIMVYRIVNKYNPIYKEKDDTIEKRVMDHCFFNNFTQRMNLNLYTFYEGQKYRTSDFAVFNTNPQPYPQIDDYYVGLTIEEQDVINYYVNKMLKSEPCKIQEENVCCDINIEKNKFNVNKYFSIPGVPYSGNDLRWRIVAILYNKLGYDCAKQVIVARFLQKDEMISALNSIHRNNSQKYLSTNYLIEQFVERMVLTSSVQDHSICLSEGDYLSNHIDNIEQELKQGSVYLVSPPNTGKSELIKILSQRLDKCIILVHQKSILHSKYLTDPIIKQNFTLIDSTNVTKINTLPNKCVCIWDTFVRLIKNRNISNYFLLLDETHNFVTQFSFRRVIMNVLEGLNNAHQLWLTGTPCGEEALMPFHSTMRFNKKSKTEYHIIPQLVQTNSKKDFRQYIMNFVETKSLEYREKNDGLNRKIFIYDNYDHDFWKHGLKEKCAHYVSIYSDTDDVKEINSTKQTSKDVVSSTNYLGEGVDIMGYDEVLVIIPTNSFVTELNIRQYINRFRDAKKVEVILIQYNTNIDNPLPYMPRDIERCREYMEGFANGFEQRNPKLDEWLKIDKLTNNQLVLITKNDRYKELFNSHFIYQSRPFNVFMSHYLQCQNDNIRVDNIIEVATEKASANITSKVDPLVLDYIAQNYYNIAYWIIEYKYYNDVIKKLEQELWDGNAFPFRKEIKQILQIIHQVDELDCLEDCVRYFVKNEQIQWKRIGQFADSVNRIQDWSNQKITYDSSIYTIQKQSQQLKSSDDKNLKILNFEIQPGITFKEQVLNYKWKMGKDSKYNLLNYFTSSSFISIFKPKYTPQNVKNKPVSLTNILTGETFSFSTQKACMLFLKTTKPTFSEFKKGNSKLNKEWSISVA